MTPRLRRAGALLILPLMLLLSSCMRIEMSTKIVSENEIVISYDLSYNKEKVKQISGTAPTKDGACDSEVAGAKQEPYEDDTYVGCKVTGTLTLAQLNAQDGAMLSLKDGVWTYSMDTENSTGSSESDQYSASMIEKMKISVTFPGKVLTHEGSSTVDGKTVTWTNPSDLLNGSVKATGQDGGGGSSWIWWLIGGLVVAALAAAAVVLVLVLRNNKKKAAAAAAAQGWGPGFGAQGQPVQYGQPGQYSQYGQPQHGPGQGGQPPFGQPEQQFGQPGQQHYGQGQQFGQPNPPQYGQPQAQPSADQWARPSVPEQPQQWGSASEQQGGPAGGQQWGQQPPPAQPGQQPPQNWGARRADPSATATQAPVVSADPAGLGPASMAHSRCLCPSQRTHRVAPQIRLHEHQPSTAGKQPRRAVHPAVDRPADR